VFISPFLFELLMKTLLIGASTKPERYAYKAAHSLVNHGHEVVLLGLQSGEVAQQPIHTERAAFDLIDTVTLYVGEAHQPEYYEYIESLKPRRVIFNPGAENPAFAQRLEKGGIEALEACTLVMLSIGTF
jgi:uncharacterized protein